MQSALSVEELARDKNLLILSDHVTQKVTFRIPIFSCY